MRALRARRQLLIWAPLRNQHIQLKTCTNFISELHCCDNSNVCYKSRPRHQLAAQEGWSMYNTAIRLLLLLILILQLQFNEGKSTYLTFFFPES